jgi:hypothetical protein
MTLDINKEISDLQGMYSKSVTAKYIRMLQFGDYKSGKTSAIMTCPRPIHIDSWDPGGSKVLQAGIKEGWIIVDNQWEGEDPADPKMFEKFDSTYRARKAAGYFEFFATYVLDSITTFSAATMNYTLKRRKRIDNIPVSGKGGDNDYVEMQAKLGPIVRDMLNLPCHVIINAHPDINEDDFGKRFIGPMVSGRLRTELPIVLDEIYYLRVQETKDGLVRKYLTQPDGIYRCGSRLATNGMIDTWENIDIRNIIKKGGYEWKDKAIPWLNNVA